MKVKRAIAACSLAAVILSSSVALADTNYFWHGKWEHGDTSYLWEPGVVYSDYGSYCYELSYAKVVNANGVMKDMWAPSDKCNASVTAPGVPFKVDYAYYDYKNRK